MACNLEVFFEVIKVVKWRPVTDVMLCDDAGGGGTNPTEMALE
jgi:hypothetical protein